MLDLNRHGLTTCGKTAAALSATVLLCLLGAATAQAVPTITKTAIPLQATGYRYQQVGSGLGAGFEATAFDDSAWSTGQAAFGTSDGPCAVNQSPPVHTLWSVNTDLLVRKSFTLPSTASAVHVLGTVDNAATVYLNGKEIGFTSTGFCTQDTIDFAAPDAVAGTNVLAVRAHDDGVASYLDQSVTYEVPTYSLCLLYDPTKSAKLGSTIPLKFQLCDADGTNLSSPMVTVHATGVAKQDDTASATAEDAGNANPDADFRYDPDLAGYIFNKTTKGLTTGTWMLTFTVGGDSEPNYYLSFDVR